MPLKIQSTQISESNGIESLLVEVAIADSPEVDTDGEILHIRVVVPVDNDAYLPKVQSKAIDRTVFLLGEVQKALKDPWNNS